MNEKIYDTNFKNGVVKPGSLASIIRQHIRQSILNILSKLYIKDKGPFLRCLYLHYVFDDQRDDFEKMIVKLKSIGTFVDTDTLISMLNGNKKVDKKYFHLSFDDGFKNNFTNAFPILLKHDVPTIFIPTSYIGANWSVTKNYLNRINYKGVYELMNWADLKDLISSGYEVGSHTKTHLNLSKISNDSKLLKDQILGSKIDLEHSLSYECKYISWPFGTLDHINLDSLKMIKNTGYKACFGAYRGTCFPNSTDLFSIPRHQVEVNWLLSQIEYFAYGNMESIK